jgi:hypothetical protein
MDKQTKERMSIFAAAFLLALAAIHRLGGGDVWWHIRLGQWLLEGHWPPAVDPFSYTAQGPLTYLEPISDVLFYLADASAGVIGLLILKSVVLFFCGSIALSIRSADIDENRFIHLSVCIWGIGWFAAAIAPRMIMRPFLFSWLFFAAFVWVICRVERTHKEVWLLLLPVLTVGWTNAHRGAILAFFVVGLATLLVWGRRGIRQPPFYYIGTTFLCAIAITLNPAGFYAFVSPFEALFSSPDMIYIQEWTTLSVPILLNEFLFFLGATVLWGIGFWMCRRRLRFANLLALFLIVASYEVRFVPYAVIAMVPGMMHDMGRFLKWVHRKLPVRETVLATLICTAGIAILLSGRFFILEPHQEGVGVARWVPQEMASFLEQTPPPGKMYNDYNFGGYLLYRLAPDIQVFVDPRTQNTIYSQEFVEACWQAPHQEKRFHQLHEEYGFNFAVIGYEGPGHRSYGSLLDDPNWALVYWDDISAVLVHRNPETEDYLSKHAYSHLDVNSSWQELQSMMATPNGESLMEDLQRNVREAPHSMRARLFLEQAKAVKLGTPAEPPP